MRGNIRERNGLEVIWLLTDRLYVAAAVVLIGIVAVFVVTGLELSDLLHQGIGSVMIAGIIWFSGIVVKAWLSKELNTSSAENYRNSLPVPD